MNRQPQHRGPSSGVRHLCILYSAWIQAMYRKGNTSSRQQFNSQSYQAKGCCCIPWVKSTLMVLNAAIIMLSLLFIYSTTEPQGQQITHAIKFKFTERRQSLKSHKTSALASTPATGLVEVPEQTCYPGWGLLLYSSSTSSSHMVQIISLNSAFCI